MNILIFDEESTDAGIAYLTEGKGAPSITLTISWKDVLAAINGMVMIALCKTWHIESDGSKLTIAGKGPTVQDITPMFASTWEMEDVDAVDLFTELARQNGFFTILPAVDRKLSSGEPVACFLRRRDVS